MARFQLGSVEFFAAIEGLALDSCRYGLQPNFGMIRFLRTPNKANPKSDVVTYNDVRAMIERCVARMEHAEARLAPIKDRNLAWDLVITAVQLDVNGDGTPDPNETLWSVFTQFARRAAEAAPPDNFTIGLDAADVHWMRGYCHLLAALGEMILAYDHQRLFDHTAQLFFANPKTPYSSVLICQDNRTEPTSPWA